MHRARRLSAMVLDIGRALFYMISSTLLMSIAPILLRWAQSDTHHFPFFIGTINMWSEAAKFLLSASFLAIGIWRSKIDRPQYRFRENIHYAVPAVLYCIQNNLNFVVLRFIDATTFAILSSGRLIATAVLSRGIMKKQQSVPQWCALGLLTISTCIYQIDMSDGNSVLRGNAVGLILLLVTLPMAALAGVYTEYRMKTLFEQSLHWQNMQLYAYGIVFNFVTAMVETYVVDRGSGDNNFFKGYDSYWAYMLILFLAVNGLFVSAVMKFLSALIKQILSSIAILGTAVLSMMFMGTPLTAQFALAFVVLFLSTVIYRLTPSEHAPVVDIAPTRPDREALLGVMEEDIGEDDSTEPARSDREVLLEELLPRALTPRRNSTV